MKPYPLAIPPQNPLTLSHRKHTYRDLGLNDSHSLARLIYDRFITSRYGRHHFDRMDDASGLEEVPRGGTAKNRIAISGIIVRDWVTAEVENVYVDDTPVPCYGADFGEHIHGD